MAVEWIDPNERRGARIDKVSLSKTGLRIEPDVVEAIGSPSWVRVGIDDETQTLVVAPAADAKGTVALYRHRGWRSSRLGSLPVLRAIHDRLGWQPGDKLVCTVRGKTLEIKRTQAKETSKRRGDLLRALGGEVSA